jgi:peptidoglycan hydrolase-like protein with peptidoglycan-binding domain
MTYLESNTILQIGSSHKQVIELQRLLSQRQKPIPLTGHFDYETELAVKSFQSRMFLSPDGIVGPLTWQVLYTGMPINRPVLSQGCTGSAVAAVQELLSIDAYYRGPVDGHFGHETHLAVQRFQADYALPTDGVVNAKTWWALSEI